METVSFSLADPPFSSYFVISFPFPPDQRDILENSFAQIENSVLRRQVENPRSSILEDEIAGLLEAHNYKYSEEDPDPCRLWAPDYSRHELDFYNPQEKIGIEVEKTEVKRVIHDVLKLVNGSMTFMPKVEYGALVIPTEYVSGSGTRRRFLSVVKRELPFYFQKIVPDNCNLRDLLIIAYEPPENPV